MCFYFSVHVKAVVKLVAIYWNARLTTPSFKKDQYQRRCWCPVLSVLGLGPDFTGRGSRSLELPCFVVNHLFRLFYRLVDTCCSFTLSRNSTHSACCSAPTSCFTASALADLKILTVISMLCILGSFCFFLYMRVRRCRCAGLHSKPVSTLH